MTQHLTALPRPRLTLADVKLLEPWTHTHLEACRKHIEIARAARQSTALFSAAGYRDDAIEQRRRMATALLNAAMQRRAVEACRERASRDVRYRADTVAAAIRVSYGLPWRVI